MRLFKFSILPILFLLSLPAVAQADTMTFTATEDTWVRSDQPSSVAGANDDEIWTQAGPPQEVGLLKFNIDPLPDNATVTDLDLTLRTNGGKSYAGTSNGPRVEAVPNTWSEATANYATVTGLANGGTVANIGAVSAGAAVSVDLDMGTTPGGQPAFRLVPEGDDMGAWSSEAPTTSNRPQLVVTYTVPTVAPQCSDGVNNDPAEDSNVDFPADLGCSGASDDSESPNPPPAPVDTDGDGVPDSTDQCDTQPGPASNNGCPVTQPPPGLIPANAVPVAAGNQEWNGTGTFTTSQCPHAIPYMTEGSTTFARFQRNPGEPQSAGGYRCEQQSSTYIGKGEYWFEWRSRYPNGYEPSPASWVTMRQWHENTSDGGGPVYLATFFQNGRPQIDGQFVSPGTQTLDVDVRQWHTYTARINFNSGTAGFAELWIDGVFSGRTTTNRTATPSNSYDKYGTYGGDSNTTRTADYDWAHAYRIP